MKSNIEDFHYDMDDKTQKSFRTFENASQKLILLENWNPFSSLNISLKLSMNIKLFIINVPTPVVKLLLNRFSLELEKENFFF